MIIVKKRPPKNEYASYFIPEFLSLIIPKLQKCKFASWLGMGRLPYLEKITIKDPSTLHSHGWEGNATIVQVVSRLLATWHHPMPPRVAPSATLRAPHFPPPSTESSPTPRTY